MAIGALLLGESGTGKTYSIKNFAPEEVKILSVQKTILPFRGKYDIVKTPDCDSIVREMKNTGKKTIVIDDFQYILGLPMMRRIGEKGWEKYSEIQQPYFDVLDALTDLPDDVIVYLTSHVMHNDDTGKVQIKTIGKALDKYITIEGLFMIVLGTQVVNGKYYFVTQNNGENTLKSPEGMFPSLLIPNDLKYVDDKIRNYYGMEGAMTDAEMQQIDSTHTVEGVGEKKKRTRTQVEAENTEKMEAYTEAITDAVIEAADGREEIPFEEAADAADTVEPPELERAPRKTRAEKEAEIMNPPEEKPKRRTRKARTVKPAAADEIPEELPFN